MIQRAFVAVVAVCCLLASCMPISYAAEDTDIEVYASYVDGDYEKAVEKLDELIKTGDEFAETLLCFGATTMEAFQQAYFNYYGREHFLDLTARMKELYDKGNLVAGMILGYVYHLGLMTEVSEETARSYFDPTEEALVALAEKSPELQQDGRFDIAEFGSKASEIETGMTVKNPMICSYIALCYLAGVGGAEKDHEKAAMWYREAMRYGVPYALDNYDLMIARGQIDATLTEYRNNLELLTERYRYSEAAYELAVLQFYCGEFDKARETLKIAASLGNQRAAETTAFSDNPIIYDGELSELFARLEQREAEIEAEKSGIPPVHEAINGDRTIYVVDLREGDPLTGFFSVLGVSVEAADFEEMKSLPVFRFQNPIENCLYFSAPMKITAGDAVDFSETEWCSVGHLQEEQKWVGGARYEYINNTYANAVVAFDDPVTLDAVSVIPGSTGNIPGQYTIDGGLSQALVGFPDRASAQAFTQRFQTERNEGRLK